MLGLIILLIAIMIIPVPFIVAGERKQYNNGVCRKCGEKLRHAATDSQGGSLWACDKCGEWFWTSLVREKVEE